MKNRVKIVMVGGGSVNWSPRLINDLLLTKALVAAEYVILDINEFAGQKMAQYGNQVSKAHGLSCIFHSTIDQKEAFSGADYIIITISTGGFKAMAYDLEIPEKYGIYQTVGDTVGPGGWARGLRNTQIFAEMARNIQHYAPQAIVLNYTNPMATLTKVFYKVSNLKTVGLCHGLFEVYSVLMQIFGLESEKDIHVRFGGTNHFFWILDLKIKGEDGYTLLREKIKDKTFADLVLENYIDGAGFRSNKWVCSELYGHYGYLPYVADRHICEFLPHYLTGDKKRLEQYQIARTSIEERIEGKRVGTEKLDAILRDKTAPNKERSRETAADIIAAIEEGQDFIDVVNLPNTGQISNLPMGSIVETLGVVNSVGFSPVLVGELPQQLLNLVLPHVNNQDMIVDAGLEGDYEKALYALYNDPLCSHLTLPQVKEMALELLKANKEYLPQFAL